MNVWFLQLHSRKSPHCQSACLVTSNSGENTKAGGEIHKAGSSVSAKNIKGTFSSIVSYLLYRHTGRVLPALVMGVKYVLVIIAFTF